MRFQLACLPACRACHMQHKSHASHARHSYFLSNDSCDIYYRSIFQNTQSRPGRSADRKAGVGGVPGMQSEIELESLSLRIACTQQRGVLSVSWLWQGRARRWGDALGVRHVMSHTHTHTQLHSVQFHNPFRRNVSFRFVSFRRLFCFFFVFCLRLSIKSGDLNKVPSDPAPLYAG